MPRDIITAKINANRWMPKQTTMTLHKRQMRKEPRK